MRAAVKRSRRAQTVLGDRHDLAHEILLQMQSVACGTRPAEFFNGWKRKQKCGGYSHSDSHSPKPQPRNQLKQLLKLISVGIRREHFLFLSPRIPKWQNRWNRSDSEQPPHDCNSPTASSQQKTAESRCRSNDISKSDECFVHSSRINSCASNA